MEISFLKSLTGPALDKASISVPSGTVPAFPEGMLKEDTRPGSAPLQEEGRTGLSGPTAKKDGLTASGTGDLPEKPLVYNPPAEKPGWPMMHNPDIVLYAGPQPENAEETIPRLPANDPIILVPHPADGNAVKLSDIDPESKIMPYGNGDVDGIGDAGRTVRTDQLTGSDPARQLPLSGSTKLPAQQEPASPSPTSPNPVTGTAAEKSETAAVRSPKLSIPINEMPAPEPVATERSQSGSSNIPAEAQPTVAGLNGAIANKLDVTETSNRRTVSSQNHEPDFDHAREAAKPDLSVGTSQIKLASGPIESLPSQLASANAGKSRTEKSAGSSAAPITVEPDMIEPEVEQKADSSVAALNPLAGWRPKQTVAGDVVSGLAMGPARATAAATGNASVQNNPVPLTSNAGETVLEFDANFLDNLAREISNIAQAKGIARFALKPEHLGRIDVEIRGGENGDDIRMTAETDTVRQFLVQSLSRLEQEIRLQGQKLTGVEIGTNLNQSQEQNGRDTASSNGLKSGQISGSPDDHDTQQYSTGNSSGQTSAGTRYA